ncbi:MAG TPA: HPP family protein [Pyrinomonadaceae bacterium]
MSLPRETIQPLKEEAQQSFRRRLTLRGEFVLALMPTVTILAVFSLVEVFSRQRLLFASLASSAFLIYLDPQHSTNSIRTLALSQIGAAIVGFIAFLIVGEGYLAASVAMVATITLMILADAMHPPAVSTALGFAFRANSENNLVLFALAVGLIAVLIILQKFSVWMLKRYQ